MSCRSRHDPAKNPHILRHQRSLLFLVLQHGLCQWFGSTLQLNVVVRVVRDILTLSLRSVLAPTTPQVRGQVQILQKVSGVFWSDEKWRDEETGYEAETWTVQSIITAEERRGEDWLWLTCWHHQGPVSLHSNWYHTDLSFICNSKRWRWMIIYKKWCAQMSDITWCLVRQSLRSWREPALCSEGSWNSEHEHWTLELDIIQRAHLYLTICPATQNNNFFLINFQQKDRFN